MPKALPLKVSLTGRAFNLLGALLSSKLLQPNQHRPPRHNPTGHNPPDTTLPDSTPPRHNPPGHRPPPSGHNPPDTIPPDTTSGQPAPELEAPSAGELRRCAWGSRNTSEEGHSRASACSQPGAWHRRTNLLD